MWTCGVLLKMMWMILPYQLSLCHLKKSKIKITYLILAINFNSAS